VLCSLISAVGIFCLGAGVSIVHGIHAIMDPAAAHETGLGLMVLFGSTLVEGYTLLVATRAVWQGAKAAGLRFWEYIRSGRDPVSVAIMAEDGAAVAGVLIAAACTKLSEATGSLVRPACAVDAVVPELSSGPDHYYDRHTPRSHDGYRS
jgi:solute carrier family 30 (zinc transporter), member 9